MAQQSVVGQQADADLRQFSRSILNSESLLRVDRLAAAMQWVAVAGLAGALVLPYSQIILLLAALSALVPPVLIAMGTASRFSPGIMRHDIFCWPGPRCSSVWPHTCLRASACCRTSSRTTVFRSALIEMVLLSLALASRVRELQRHSVTDALTGIFNRRFFDDCLTEEYARGSRYGQALSLMLIDVDHFKTYNDTHGHQFGDDALRSVARQLRKTIRKTDRLCRYGGEEFVILMPATSANDARRLAERQREQVSKLRLARGAVTVSIGVATLPDVGIWSLPDLVEAADKALYTAKDSGLQLCGDARRGVGAIGLWPRQLAAGTWLAD